MSIGKTFYQRLISLAGVTALLGDRIYPNRAPDGAQRPYAVYDVISNRRGLTHDKKGTWRMARIQIDVYATSNDSATTISDTIADLLHATNWADSELEVYGVQLDEQQTQPYEAEVQLHRSSLDFLVNYGVIAP